MEYQSGAVRPVDSIGEGWNIIKNDYWMYVLMSFVMFVIVIIVYFILAFISGAIVNILGFGLGAVTRNSAEVAKASAFIIPQIVAQIVGFFTTIILSTVSGVLMCGIYKSLSKVANGQGRADFADLFGGLENISSCLIYSLIISVVNFIVQVALIVIFAVAGVSVIGLGVAGMLDKNGQPNPAVIGGLLMGILAFIAVTCVIYLIIGALTAFVYPLIGERNVSGGEAFLLSVKSGLANIGGIIILVILLGLMGVGGAFGCCIGIVFVAPIINASLFAAFQNVFGRVSYQQQQPPPPPNFGQQPGY